ncbi:Neurobeachin [Bagarius yarrelli]|uniref:Neurobeachin n=1 Tax=Bagarius yarrelli TaxID=175774 RepID=A0A556TRT7_BAGYA|nr:Neurobeachin [Bagarius yarrelli]
MSDPGCSGYIEVITEFCIRISQLYSFSSLPPAIPLSLPPSLDAEIALRWLQDFLPLEAPREWQNSIQKNAGLAFIELINEGRLLCHAMKDHIVRVANEAEFILNRQRAEDVHKHAEFESTCAQYAADRREEEKMCDHLISAAKHRDRVTANQLKQKIINILTNKHGAWGALTHSQLHDFWRLDYWEDDLRRRRRFVRNPFGSTHLDISCKSLEDYGHEETDLLKGRKGFRSHAVVSQSPETELMLEGEDDTASLLQDKDMDNLAGPVLMSTPAHTGSPRGWWLVGRFLSLQARSISRWMKRIRPLNAPIRE